MSSICSRMQKDFCNLHDNKKVSSKITFCPVIGSHRRRRHSFSYKIRAEIKAIRQLPTKGPVSSSCKIVTVALSFNNIQSAIKILIFHLYRTHLYSFQFKFCHRHHHESKEVLTVSDYILQLGGEQRRNQEFRFRFRQCRYRNFWQEKAREFVILWIDLRE